jgi:hypothetical protein
VFQLPILQPWQADTLLYGRNNSVYHRLLNAGFAAIDSINAPRAWSLVYKKNDPTFQPKYDYTEGIYDPKSRAGRLFN